MLNSMDSALFHERVRNFFDAEKTVANNKESTYGRLPQINTFQKRMMKLSKKDFEEVIRSIDGILVAYEKKLSDEQRKRDEENLDGEKVNYQTTQVISSGKGEEIKAI